MVTIPSLWLAIVLSSVLVFVASFIVWTMMPYHRSDYKPLPDEDAARQALGGNVPPGMYNIPNVPSRDALKDPAFAAKFADGPIGFLTVLPNGVPNMGKQLAIWFIYLLAVSGTVAYVASRTLDPGAEYLRVFQVVGTVAWLAYGASHISEAVWFGRPWSAIFKQLFDALIYGSLTAGIFAWLWPA